MSRLPGLRQNNHHEIGFRWNHGQADLTQTRLDELQFHNSLLKAEDDAEQARLALSTFLGRNRGQTDFVVRINPATGAVAGWIDFSGLLSPADRDASTDVLNGIAWDAAGDRLFITGKFWPKLFEVRLEPKP